MPPHLFADRPAQPPEPGSVDALIKQTRRLRGDVDAVRRDTVVDDDDAQGRWQRALCDLAVHQLDDLGEHLGQLKEGLPPVPELDLDLDRGDEDARILPEPAAESGQTRVGSAEWNLLTDEVTWSDELFQIFGRSPEAGPLSLDELGSTLFSEDQPLLTRMVTACLVDGKAIDGEFRIVRTDGRVRTLHVRGEPVLDNDGCTASMWAVLRDVSELRRSERAVRESRESLQRQQQIARTEHRLAVELQEAVLPSWRGSLRFPHGSNGTLDVAAHYLPSASSALIGGDWYDALELPDGSSMLTVGDLTGHGVTATSGMAMMLGALRGMAMAGIQPGPLMGWLNQLLETSVQPALGSAVCCRYDPARGVLSWAQAGHPAPLLFRNGEGRALQPPEGVLLGATSGATYGQAEERLEAGDVLVLHTDGLTPRSIEFSRADSTERLLGLAPRLSAVRSAQEGVRTVIEEFGETEREDDACVLVARIEA
ncbi:PP2C family protein-serine/threonine phosphatase [Streptomyces antimicrobicus]|uniref:SpoIIE family protein phosphatase n=1 Tax=Streptomyces antimicrobicus TaxID=2883108 RepID=A0ABS8B8U2_9ACTN|nr:SpoIIE family protein phosphatase [Streptomyces antimicrobicus]MCB5181031.1 SpoIIE family protein phosphatase [Streptomyces antimicrobicus]